MRPERWSRVVEILEEIRAARPEVRAALLAARAEGDEELMAEVRSLLEHAEADPRFLETPALGEAVRAPQTPEEVAVLAGPVELRRPAAIGGFRILHPLATGGMGTVYEAEQEHPRRRVALKLVRPGLVSPAALRRFEHEVELLARLDHPGIARIHAAGTWDDGVGGVPWLAMELVQGARPITERTRELPRRERLELFARVCDAVFHAHQKGVVHRDLKPSNVLVDAIGRPRVIDFGVARAIDGVEAPGEELTHVGQIVGTLGYMSPEQCGASPGDVDTRSDVYSLGVLLFEVLTGCMPHDVTSTPVAEVVRRVREEPPRRPSAVDPTLRGELETILLTALEKDRERRYPSAHELAQDVRRFLACQPILAHPPGIGRRVQLLVRRHRAAGAAVATSALAHVAAAVVSTDFGLRSARAAKRERVAAERSRREAATSDRALGLFTEIFGAGDPVVSRGAEITVVEAVRRAAERLDRESDIEPAIRVRLLESLGAVLRSLGAFEPARARIQEAIALRQEVPDGRGEDLERLLQLLVAIYDDLNDHERGVETAREVLALREARLGPGDPETLVARASLGTQLMRLGRLAQAEPLLADACQRWRGLLDENDDRFLGVLHDLALLDRLAGRLELAEERLSEVLTRSVARSGDDHPNVLKLRTNLIIVQSELGRLAEAEESYRSLISAQQRVFGGTHPVVLGTRFNRALLLSRLERFEEAEAELLAVEELQRGVLPEGHPWIGETLNMLGYLYTRLERTEELGGVMERTLAHRRVELGAEHPETLAFQEELVTHLTAVGRLEGALRLAVDLVERTSPGAPELDARLGLVESLRAATAPDSPGALQR